MNKRAHADPSEDWQHGAWHRHHGRADHGPLDHGPLDHGRHGHDRSGHQPAGGDAEPDPGGDQKGGQSTDPSDLAVLIGGFAAAAGELSLATGMVQSLLEERAGVSIARGEAVFEAYGDSQQPGLAFAAADTWLEVAGADLVLRWDREGSGGDADSAWAHSEIDYIAIDIHAWMPARPIVIELEQAFARPTPAADAEPFNYAAVVASVEAQGMAALALAATEAFTDSQFSFVHAMALASL